MEIYPEMQPCSEDAEVAAVGMSSGWIMKIKSTIYMHKKQKLTFNQMPIC